MAALAVMAWVGACACGKARGRLGLRPLPLPFLAAAVLGSTPVLYAVERGNCDLVVLMLIVAAASALRGASPGRDVLAGACLALAAWIKVYPGLLLLGVLALGRWRAVMVATVAGVLIGLADLPGTVQFVANLGPFVVRDAPAASGAISETTHTLTGCWSLFWAGTPLAWLGGVHGAVAWVGLVLPPIGAVSYRVWRCAAPQALVYPYLTWLAGAATFLPPVSNDYNLIFLPLAALAVWDRRDSVTVHLAMAPMLLWWQPWRLPIGPRALLLFKVAGLVAVGLSLLRRAREQQPVARQEVAGLAPVAGLARAA
jgi:hypothetical protein